jgi:hypothetical protein
VSGSTLTLYRMQKPRVDRAGVRILREAVTAL